MSERSAVHPPRSWQPGEDWDRWLSMFRRRVAMEVNDQVKQGFVEAGILCHNYWRVRVGQTCCRCRRLVRAKDSGIGCPCGHRWFCW